MMIDESGAMNYHPLDEIYDIMIDVQRLRKSIQIEETKNGMQMNM